MPPPGDQARRLSGPRFVIVLLGAPVVVAVIVILVGVIVIANRGDEAEACEQEPTVCAVIQAYVAARNERDARGLQRVLTERGLANLLGVTSQEELAQRLQLLSPADRIDGVEVTQVKIAGDRATVVARFTQRDEEFPGVYQLVRDDSRWLIDG